MFVLSRFDRCYDLIYLIVVVTVSHALVFVYWNHIFFSSFCFAVVFFCFHSVRLICGNGVILAIIYVDFSSFFLLFSASGLLYLIFFLVLSCRCHSSRHFSLSNSRRAFFHCFYPVLIGWRSYSVHCCVCVCVCKVFDDSVRRLNRFVYKLFFFLKLLCHLSSKISKVISLIETGNMIENISPMKMPIAFFFLLFIFFYWQIQSILPNHCQSIYYLFAQKKKNCTFHARWWI